MIQFSCDCGRQLQAREDDVGKSARCPACGQIQTIPASSRPRREEEEDRDRDRPEAVRVRAERPKRRRSEEDDEDEPGERRGPPDQSSGKATTSLILGLMSFPCVFNILTGLPAIIFGILALRDIGRSKGRLGGSGMAIAGLVCGCLGICMLVPVLLLLPAVWSVREAAARVKSQNNLKQIGMAMHNVHSTYGYLPAATAYRDARGKPLLSWRVAILPFIEQQNLAMQFKYNEPWDSPHNKQFLARMPPVYLLPGQQNDGSGMTHYQVFVGPGTVFEDRNKTGRDNVPGVMPAPMPGIRLTEILDGTSNTIMAVEAANPVPWTKPDDLPFDPNGPLPALGSPSSSRFNVLFADGSVRVWPRSTPEQTLRLAITRNDGTIITLP